MLDAWEVARSLDLRGAAVVQSRESLAPLSWQTGASFLLPCCLKLS